ncbi:Peroxidasin-like 6, partial [Homarus americanus]
TPPLSHFLSLRYLYKNRIRVIERQVFQELDKLEQLRLDSNALVCDCQLMWLAQMVKEKQHTTQVAATCQFPSVLQGKSLTSLNDSEFQCRGKPLIKEGPADVDVKFGGTAYFTCKVEGNPQPEVVWFHNNEVIGDNERYNILNDGTLMIENTQDGDVGYYECMATNPMGEVKSRKAKMVPEEQQDEVRHEQLPTKPRFLLLPNDVNVTEGSPVEIECQASGIPKPDITWTKNDEPIVEGPRIQISSRGAFSVSSAIRNDSALYRCTAANHLGRIAATATLRVLVAPKLLVEPDDLYASPGSSIHFTCRADGVPHPSSLGSKMVNLLCHLVASLSPYMMKESTPAVPRTLQVCRKLQQVFMFVKRIESDGSLFVYNVTQDDAGMYECSAQNPVGYDTANARVTVQEDPRPHVGDQFLHQSFEEARDQVNRAVNDTISQLFQRDRSRTPHPHELLRIFRFPSSEGREIARATEMIEQTLNIVMRHVESGMVFNLTTFSYQDLLSPEKLFLLTNLSGCLAHRRSVYCDDMCFHAKYRTIDGTCNNLRKPLWGSSLTGFRRILSPIYENGFNTPIGWSKTKRYHGFFKPSARLVSSRIISTEEVSPDHHCTHMLMQSCDYASPCFPIEIPPDDPRTAHRCMEFTRSSGICGSGMTSIYGSSAAEVRLLRNMTHNRGQLRHGIFMPSGKPLMPFSEGAPVDCRRDLSESGIDCFLAGDIRANEQAGLTAMHTVWFREHNRIAEAFSQINPHWDADTVFYEARKIVGAQIQHITYTHWLPHIIGPQGMEQLGEYRGYNPDLEPTISNVFATGAFRFGHSLINPILHRLNATFQPIPEGHLPLHKAFFSPWRIVQEGGIDPLLRGLFATPAKLKMPGQFLNTELTEKLFRAVHEVALDLASLNIQRGRDHALPGYIEWRRACNLSVPENFDQLRSHISSVNIRNNLKQLYGHPGNVDLWVGGLLEDPVEGARVGPTFLCLLVDQFRRLRDGDRFWYENPTIFKTEQLTQIKQVTLGRVICDNGDKIEDMTPDVFVLPREQNPAFMECSKLPYVDLRIWTDCCKDCRNAGNFISLTQGPNIRFRRQAQFSHIEDQEHILMGITSGKQEANNEVDPSLMYSNNSENITYSEYRESPVPRPHHSYRQDGVRGWVPRTKHKEVKSDSNLGSYEQDMTEQRIEGIEVLVEQLSRTVIELNKKVTTLEQKCSGSIRKRRRKLCRDEEGHERHPGESWHKDPCTTCKCRRGNVECRVLECPPVTCDNPITQEDQCCPVC